MTNVITADFNGTQVLFQNDAYINATSIAKRFKKQPKDYLKSSRTKEYVKALINLSKSNRTKILLQQNQLVKIKNGSVKNGGGTWLHPKLAIDFARWLSAEFAVWCDEQIESILYKNIVSNQPKLSDLSTTETRVPLKDAVNRLVALRKLPYNVAWKMVHQKFGVEHAHELTNQQVDDGLRYVHELTLSNVLEGEVIQRQIDNDSLEKNINALTLMEYGAKAEALQNEHLREVVKLINDACITLNNAMKYRGAVYDGFNESALHMQFTREEREQARKRSTEMINTLQKEKRIF